LQAKTRCRSVSTDSQTASWSRCNLTLLASKVGTREKGPVRSWWLQTRTWWLRKRSVHVRCNLCDGSSGRVGSSELGVPNSSSDWWTLHTGDCEDVIPAGRAPCAHIISWTASSTLKQTSRKDLSALDSSSAYSIWLQYVRSRPMLSLQTFL